MATREVPATRPLQDERATLPISVVIAAYNRAEMLRRAIASVRAQRPAQPAEIVVVDDASTDSTAEVARDLGAVVVRHRSNRGEGASRNTAIEAAGQPWIAVLDSDDEWLPWHLDNLWRNRRDHAIVSAASLRCGRDPADDRFHGVPPPKDRVLTSPADLLFTENVVPASGVMFRRDTVLKAGGYDGSLPKSADLDLLVRCLEHGTARATPTVSVIYHVHAGQVSSDRTEMWASHTAVAERYSGRPWWSRRRFGAWRTVVAWDSFRAGGGMRRLVRALARPGALAALLWSRLRIRRMSSRVGRDGRASLALLPGSAAGSVPEEARVVDLRARSRIAAYMYLARQPSGKALAGAALDLPVLRALKIPVIPPEQ
jgi:GT2 family glycosyltransferase